ncbi:DUF6542 domain-containing protein [Jatrophihabitans sp. YIM 134969]
MTESRPPGPSRHADPRSSDVAGANPLQRPLPPGLQRRPDPSRRGPAATVTARPAHSAPDQPAPRQAPPAERSADGAAPTERPTGRPSRSERLAAESAAGRRAARADATAIPLMAPPAWQVAGVQAEERQSADERPATEQRGLPGWAGLVVLLVITGIGGLVDALAGAGIKGTFSIGLVVGSLVAILVVRRSGMFPVVVAPPLVYFIASAVLLYVRSDGLSNRAAITDAAASWLVYGFPAIAGATALVLIVAGVRMILHR